MIEQNSQEEELYIAALDISDFQQRQAYLKGACGKDEDLRARLLKRLTLPNATAASSEDGVASPLGSSTLDFAVSAHSGTIIAGKYKLLNVIDEGGMGSVWMAEQKLPVKRLVALKLIKAGMDSRSVLARFEAERQALALMDHPNIARILDGGISETGSPYFVMELVKGVPITEFCDARKLSPKQRLELFIPVCQAIQHAHQKGIIHRDIKPSNVMVALYDDKPVPKVIDFGVAKATGHKLTEQTLNTGFSVVGTPQYMSPEQATFNQLDIDTRSDIYSLGILLYELLAGSPPFQKQELEKAGYLEILRVIREEEPPRPSTKLSTAKGLPSLSASRSTEPKKLTGLLRNELDWIVMKALEKDRARRYETANGFAADIGRYLAGEAVQAHPPSQAYRLKKFLRKNKGPVIAASLVFATLIAGIVGTTLGLFEADRQRLIAVRKQKEANDERSKAVAAAEAEMEQRKKAEKAEEDALEAYRATTDDAIAELIGSKTEFGPQEKKYLENTIERWKQFAERQGEDERSRAIRGEGHYRVGMLLEDLGDERGKTETERAIEIQKKLVLDFPSNPKYQFHLVQSLTSMGSILGNLAKEMEANDYIEKALEILPGLTAKYPENGDYCRKLSTALYNKGFGLSAIGDLQGSNDQLMIAIDYQQAMLAKFQDDKDLLGSLARSRQALCGNYWNLGRFQDSLKSAQASLSVAQKLVERFPNDPRHLIVLGDVTYSLAISLNGLERHKEALLFYHEAIEIANQLVIRFPSQVDYSDALAAYKGNLGCCLTYLGRFEEAVVECEGALEIHSKVHYDVDIPFIMVALIEALLGDCQFERTVVKSQENEERLLKRIKQSPESPDYKRYLAWALWPRGEAFARLGQDEEARGASRKAIDVANALVKEFPDNSMFRKTLYEAHRSMAKIQFDSGRFVEARKQHQDRLDLQEQLAKNAPDKSIYKTELAKGYREFAHFLIDVNQPNEALEWFTKSIDILNADLENDPQSELTKRSLASSYSGQARALAQLQNQVAANEAWKRALELAPPELQPEIFVERVTARYKAGLFNESLAEINQLARSPELEGKQWYKFAAIYASASSKVPAEQKLYTDRAMVLLNKAVGAGWKDIRQLIKDSDFDPLRARKDFKDLVTKMEAKASTVIKP